ncbi:MAG: WD40 repeat domain-containing protein, partial [Planctomycetota bacterium]
MAADWTPLKVLIALPDSGSFDPVRATLRRVCQKCGCDAVEIARSFNRREYWPRFRAAVGDCVLVIADLSPSDDNTSGGGGPAVDVVVEATVAREVNELPVWVLSSASGDPRPILFRDDRLFVYGSGRRAVQALEEEFNDALREFVGDWAVGNGTLPPWEREAAKKKAAAAAAATPAAPAAAGSGSRGKTTRRYSLEPAAPVKKKDEEKEIVISKGVTNSDVHLVPAGLDAEAEELDGMLITAGIIAFDLPDPDATRGPTIASEPALRPVSLAPRPELTKDLDGHNGHITTCVTAHAEAGIALSGGEDGVVMLYDLQRLRRLGPLELHRGSVTGLSMNLRGNRAVSTGADGKAGIWNIESSGVGLEDDMVVHRDGARCVVVLPIRSQQLRVVTGSEDGEIVKWNLTRKEPSDHWRAHDGPVNALSMSNDGGRVLSGGDDSMLVLWDMATGRDIMMLTRAHVTPIRTIALSFDGHRAISASEDACKLWD